MSVREEEKGSGRQNLELPGLVHRKQRTPAARKSYEKRLAAFLTVYISGGELSTALCN